MKNEMFCSAKNTLDFPDFGAIIVSNKALKEKQYALRVHEQRRTHAKAG